MNDALKMQISAFVDGELSDAEAELLTRRLDQDAELRRQAAAYLEIGRLLRGERSLPGLAGVRERLAAAVAAEDLPVVATGNRLLKPAAGFAIAASVAVLALVGLRQLDLPEPVSGTPVPTAAIAVDDGSSYTEPSASDLVSDRPSDRLMQYYRSHGETSGELGANGILSRLVTLELRGGDLVEVAPAADDADGSLESTGQPAQNTTSDSERDQ